MPELTSCNRRNQVSTCSGDCLRTTQVVRIIIVVPSSIPISGERTMKAAILPMAGADQSLEAQGGQRGADEPPGEGVRGGRRQFPTTRSTSFHKIAPNKAAKMTMRTVGRPLRL